MASFHRGEQLTGLAAIGRSCFCLGLALAFSLNWFVSAQPVGADEPTPEELAAAVRKSIPLLERGAQGSTDQRPHCFTCHNQGLPILALSAARRRGFAIHDERFGQQVAFIVKFLDKNRERFLQGKGTGGEIATAGYALWALEAGEHAPSDTTAAVANYLLAFERDRAAWRMTSHRPPSEHSHFTANYLAARGLRNYATDEQRESARERTVQARDWFLDQKPDDTEDHVFRLWGLTTTCADADQIAQARQQLVDLQQTDGGWKQKPDMETDSYATGTALVALHEAGGMPPADEVYRRGVAYLLRSQLEDGSWHVPSRSKPFQTYFESGFPHGKDQFISITASAWATWAICLASATP